MQHKNRVSNEPGLVITKLCFVVFSLLLSILVRTWAHVCFGEKENKIDLWEIN